MGKFEKYEKRIKRLAKVKAFLWKYRLIVLIATAATVAITSGYTFSKGAFTEEITIPSELVYGEEYSASTESLFSNYKLEYCLVGSDEWTTEKPTNAGEYLVRAVSNKSFGKVNYSKAQAFTIKPRSVSISISPETILYGANPSYSDNLNEFSGGIYISRISFGYEGFASDEVKVHILPGSIVILDANGNDISNNFVFDDEEEKIDFEKIEKTVTLIQGTAQTATYDGQPFDEITTASFEIADMPYTDSFTVNSLRYKNELGDVIDTPVFPGNYTCEIVGYSILNDKSEDTSEYYTCDSSIVVGFTITKREVTVKTDSVTKVYDGTALTAATSENYRLKDGFTLGQGDVLSLVEGSPIPEITFCSEGELGTISNVLSFKICNAVGDDVTEAYDLSYEYGTLSVTPRNLEIKTKSASRVFNLETFSCQEYDLINDTSLAGDDSIKLSNEKATILHAGTTENIFSVLVYCGEEDVSSSYNIQYTYGELSVTQAPLTVTLKDFSAVYTGKEYVYGTEVRFSAEGTLYGDAQITVSTTISGDKHIDVGEYTISATDFDIVGGEKRDYSVTYANDNKATLSITKKQVKVRLTETPSFTFGNTEYSYSDKAFVILSDEVAFDVDKDSLTLAVSYFDSKNTELVDSLPRHAGAYKVRGASLAGNKAGNYEVEFENESTLTISRRTVVIGTDVSNLTKVYDGTAFDGYNAGDFYVVPDNGNDAENTALFDRKKVTVDVKYYIDEVETSPVHANTYSVKIVDIHTTDTWIENDCIFECSDEVCGTLIITPIKINIKPGADGTVKAYTGEVLEYEKNSYRYVDGSSVFILDDSIEVTTETDEKEPTDVTADGYIIRIVKVTFTSGGKSCFSDYDIDSSTAGLLTIRARKVTIKARNMASVVYGDKYAYNSGFEVVLDEGVAKTETYPLYANEALTPIVTYKQNGTIVNSPKDVGIYDIFVTGYSTDERISQNYEISYSLEPASFEITVRTVNITATDLESSIFYEKVSEYDTSSFVILDDVSDTAFDIYEELRSKLTVSVRYDWTNFAQTKSENGATPYHAGNYKIFVISYSVNVGKSLSNYNIVSSEEKFGTLTIEQRRVDLYASTPEEKKTYDRTKFHYNNTKFNAYDETSKTLLNDALIDGSLLTVGVKYKDDTESYMADLPFHAGNYKIYVDSYESSNTYLDDDYDFTYNEKYEKYVGTLVIDQAPVTISSGIDTTVVYTYNKTKQDVTFDPCGEGFVSGDSLADCRFEFYFGKEKSDFQYAGKYSISLIQDSISISKCPEDPRSEVSDYVFSYSNEEIVMNKRAVTIQIKEQSKTYDTKKFSYDGNYYIIQGQSGVDKDEVFLIDGCSIPKERLTVKYFDKNKEELSEAPKDVDNYYVALERYDEDTSNPITRDAIDNNYDIKIDKTMVPLTINQCKVTIIPNPDVAYKNKEYDGKPYPVDDYVGAFILKEYDEDSLIAKELHKNITAVLNTVWDTMNNGDPVNDSLKSEIYHAGSYKVYINGVKKINNAFNLDNYYFEYSDTDFSTFVITSKPVTIAASDYSDKDFTYDGTELMSYDNKSFRLYYEGKLQTNNELNGKITVTIRNDWYIDDVKQLTNPTEYLHAGEYRIYLDSYSKADKDSLVDNDYDITVSKTDCGKLIINQRTIYIRPKMSDTNWDEAKRIYNGSEFAIDQSWEYTEKSSSDDKKLVEGHNLEAVVKVKDFDKVQDVLNTDGTVTSYTMYIDSWTIVGNNYNLGDYLVDYDDTSDFTIMPIVLEVVTDSCIDHIYDGNDYSYKNFNAIEVDKKLLNGHKIKADDWKIITTSDDPDTDYDNTCVVTVSNGDDEDVTHNYKITYKYGKIKVKKQELFFESGISFDYPGYSKSFSFPISDGFITGLIKGQSVTVQKNRNPIAGNYTINKEDVTVSADGADVTKWYSINSFTLTINKINVTIKIDIEFSDYIYDPMKDYADSLNDYVKFSDSNGNAFSFAPLGDEFVVLSNSTIKKTKNADGSAIASPLSPETISDAGYYVISLRDAQNLTITTSDPQKVNVSGSYYFTFENNKQSFKIQIDRKEITLTSSSKEIQWAGADLTDSSYDKESLLNQGFNTQLHSVKILGSTTLNAYNKDEQPNSDKVANVLRYKILDKNNNEVTKNYKITEEWGKLSFKFTVQSLKETKKSHEYSGEAVYIGKQDEDNRWYLASTYETAEKTEVSVKVYYTKFAGEKYTSPTPYAIKTDTYRIAEVDKERTIYTFGEKSFTQQQLENIGFEGFNYSNVSLTIEQRQIWIKPESVTLNYDTKEHTLTNVEYIYGELAQNDMITGLIFYDEDALSKDKTTNHGKLDYGRFTYHINAGSAKIYNCILPPDDNDVTDCYQIITTYDDLKNIKTFKTDEEAKQYKKAFDGYLKINPIYLTIDWTSSASKTVFDGTALSAKNYSISSDSQKYLDDNNLDFIPLEWTEITYGTKDNRILLFKVSKSDNSMVCPDGVFILKHKNCGTLTVENTVDITVRVSISGYSYYDVMKQEVIYHYEFGYTKTNGNLVAPDHYIKAQTVYESKEELSESMLKEYSQKSRYFKIYDSSAEINYYGKGYSVTFVYSD